MEGVKKAHVQGQAPDFKSMALMPGGSFKELSLADYKGKYLVLFFYPLDFTFVCPTEITQFSDRVADFEKEGAAVVGCSIDSHFAHLAWSQTARSEGGIAGMQIPLLADVTHNICKSYGVQSEGGVALRGVFIIDGNQRVRSMIVNDLPVGRNVDEVLRIVKAFKYTDAHGDVMPCNWTPGSKTMKADPVKSQEYFSKVSGTKRGADVAQGASKRNRN